MRVPSTVKVTRVLGPLVVLAGCAASYGPSTEAPIARAEGETPDQMCVAPESAQSANAYLRTPRTGSELRSQAASLSSIDDAIASARAGSSCPPDMILVEGDYCPDSQQNCLQWMEDPARFPFARCAVFAEPSACKSDRVRLRFCIDEKEAADEAGMPVADVSWTQASAACAAQSKRLCQEREWVFACEGESMTPYPYGFVRNPSVCNFERTENLVTNKGELADHRLPVDSNPQCRSQFGVQNMVGNIDEWVVLDRPHYSAKNGGRKMMSGLKGGWWGPLRNRCRPTTVDHDEVFHELQTGFRCCASVE